MNLIDKDGEIDPVTEDYYLELFREMEELLDTEILPTKLPQIIENIIENIHWDDVSRRRRTNWQTLNELIGDKVESFCDHLPKWVVPLGYMIRLKNRDIVKAKLAAERIFTPVHWPLPDEIEKKRIYFRNSSCWNYDIRILYGVEYK